MNCLDDYIIQLYVDGELEQNDIDQLESHIKSCSNCQQKLNQRKRISQLVKQEINGTEEQYNNIPEFTLPEATSKRIFKQRKITAITSTAAASLLFLLWLSNGNQQNKINDMIYYSMEFEIDANIPLHEMSFTMTELDSEGNITEHFIE